MTITVTHPRTGSTFEVPQEWEVNENAHPDYVIAIEPHGGPDAFRANVVLTVADNDGADFSEWQNNSESDLPLVLADYLLIDRQKLEIAGLPAGRRLAHHTTPDGAAVSMQQWFVASELDGRGVGHTLTITVPDLAFADFTELTAEIVASWQPGGARA